MKFYFVFYFSNYIFISPEPHVLTTLYFETSLACVHKCIKTNTCFQLNLLPCLPALFQHFLLLPQNWLGLRLDEYLNLMWKKYLYIIFSHNICIAQWYPSSAASAHCASPSRCTFPPRCASPPRASAPRRRVAPRRHALR